MNIDYEEIEELLEDELGLNEADVDVDDDSEMETYHVYIATKEITFDFNVSDFAGCCGYCIVHNIDITNINTKQQHELMHRIISKICKDGNASAMLAVLIPSQKNLIKSHIDNGWEEIGRVKNNNSGNMCILFKKDLV